MPTSAELTALQPATTAWPQRVLTLLVWAAVSASALGWGLRWWPEPLPAAARETPRAQAEEVDPEAVARGLGAASARVEHSEPVQAGGAPTRWVLVGVLAGASHRGAALIAADNKPARTVRVGGWLDAGLLLQSVDARQAVLAADMQGPALQVLPLVKPAPGGAAAPAGPDAALSRGAVPVSAMPVLPR